MTGKRNSTPAHAKHAAPTNQSNTPSASTQMTQVIPQQSSAASANAEVQATQVIPSAESVAPAKANNSVAPSNASNPVTPSAAPAVAPPANVQASYADPNDATQVLSPAQTLHSANVAYNAAQSYAASQQYASAQSAQNYAAAPQYSAAQYAAQNYAAPAYSQAQMNPVDLSAKSSRRGKAGKVVAITLVSILALVGIAYVAGSVYFSSHFLPNTKAGNIDLSLMSTEDAEKAIDSSLSSYKLSISGQGLDMSLSADDAGLSIDSSKVVNSMISSTNQWAWPLNVTSSHDLTSQMVTSVNGTGLEDKVRSAVDAFNATARQPENASVSYSESSKQFVVNPEVSGTAIDVDKVIAAADDALVDMTSSVKLTDDALSKPSILSTDVNLKTLCDNANALLKSNLDLQLSGTSIATVDAGTIAGWVNIGEDNSVSLNQEAITAWCRELGSKTDTVGTERTYSRADGKSVTVSGGTYGWSIDEASLATLITDDINGGVAGVVDVPSEQTAAKFAGQGAADWGRYIDIDLSEQYVRYYDESGNIIWESACISGKPDGEHDTPTGVYMLNAARTNEKLEGYENGVKIYTSYVSYWMPFVGNAIGLHDASWQPSFGGSMYANGYGSHGCVNLPVSAAASLYSLVTTNGYIGDCVISHY